MATATTTDAATDDPALEASIRAAHLEEFIAVQQTLVDETRIHLQEDGLWSRQPDPANVALVDVELDAGAFGAYDVSGTLDVFGLDLDDLAEFLGFADSDDEVDLRLDAETRTLTVAIDRLERSFATIDPEAITAEPGEPDIELPARFALPGKTFARALRASEMVSDHVLFAADADAVTCSAEGDTDSVEAVIDGTSLDEETREQFACIDFDAEGTVEALYSLEYLSDLRPVLPDDAAVTLRFGDEMPARFRFTSLEGALDVQFDLAPRIQTQ